MAQEAHDPADRWAEQIAARLCGHLLCKQAFLFKQRKLNSARLVANPESWTPAQSATVAVALARVSALADALDEVLNDHFDNRENDAEIEARTKASAMGRGASFSSTNEVEADREPDRECGCGACRALGSGKIPSTAAVAHLMSASAVVAGTIADTVMSGTATSCEEAGKFNARTAKRTRVPLREHQLTTAHATDVFESSTPEAELQSELTDTDAGGASDGEEGGRSSPLRRLVQPVRR